MSTSSRNDPPMHNHSWFAAAGANRRKGSDLRALDVAAEMTGRLSSGSHRWRSPRHLRREARSGSTAAARITAARLSRRARLALVMGFSYSGHSRTIARPAPGVSGGRCHARPSRWRSSTASKQGRCHRMTISWSAAMRRACSARCGLRSAWSKSNSTKRSAGAVRVRRRRARRRTAISIRANGSPAPSPRSSTIRWTGFSATLSKSCRKPA